ncbi:MULTISPECIES: ATP-binding cassette domain-containing protein [Actinomyces]|uniref:ATP-binding cassette domain-containing protein n=1 Tax=Actinomyces TaxID=1654 RepID=UPI00135787C7|nr:MULTISPECIES: ABC transporter ATP-binding protein [Actinomyces]
MTAALGAFATRDGHAAAVSARGIKQSFRGREILRDVDLVAEPGSFHGLIGPSGAGKTALLKVLYGARRAQAGEVSLLGRAPGGRDRALLARVGVQATASSFFSHATVWEHLSTVAALLGASQARAHQFLDQMGLGRLRDWRVELLPVGARRMLALASAMVHHPEVLFLDEPMADLDRSERADLLDALDEARGEGTTVICAARLLGELGTLCDCVSVLDDGRVVAVGPASSFVADSNRSLTPPLGRAAMAARSRGRVTALDPMPAVLGNKEALA